MKKAELIRIIDDGYTAIIKVWQYKFMGRIQTYNTIHPRK